MTDLPVVVLVSGNGSNLQVLIDHAKAGTLPIVIRAVVSNEPDAYGVVRAGKAGIPSHVVDHRSFDTPREFCRALSERVDHYDPGLVVLAGFMRILQPEFVVHYRNRLINLHPSLLPKYPGLHTHRRALEHGDRVHGASVHFVTDKLDAGPVVIQGRVDVEASDTPETLQRKVQAVEHRILPTAVLWIAQQRLSVHNGQVLLDGRVDPEQGLSPGRDPVSGAKTVTV
jgi:phosphoribosylglycinamide formyltransferase-1